MIRGRKGIFQRGLGMTKKDEVFDYMVMCAQKCGTEDKVFNTQELAEELQMQRSNLSTLLNDLVMEGKLEKLQGRPVPYRIANRPGSGSSEESCFKELLGYNGSLKNVTRLAKAAILYPEHSLNTLIVGPGGSGKTYFAYLMYRFAKEKGVIADDAPFIRFNCRYYEGQDEEIRISLFGRSSNDCESALQKARGGILVVDHIDLLPVRARDMLLELLEDEGKNSRDTILICAVNDNAKQSLLHAYAAKFSVRIDLPSLKARRLEERFALVQNFFVEEAARMDKPVKVNAELLRCMLLCRCENNVKQLKSDIKIGCANAYVREFNENTDELYIYMNDMPSIVRQGLLYYKDFYDEVEGLIPKNYSYAFSKTATIERTLEKNENPGEERESIYDMIDRKAAELRGRGITDKEASSIINAELEYDMKQLVHRMNGKSVNRESLLKIVDRRIVAMVEEFLREASLRFGRVYPESIFYGLCLHLSATLERANVVQRLSNSRVMETVENHREEYAFCMKFSTEVEREFNVQLSIDEVVFITMFICNNTIYDKPVNKPVILLAMHGRSTASSMADVVNSLVKGNNTYAFDMPLSMDMHEAYNELKARIMEVDKGQGILLLYDMGSLRTMAEMIMRECGVRIRMLEMPGALIALDSSRKASCLTSLDELYDKVAKTFQDSYQQMTESYARQCKHKIIITLCMSGKGAAVSMKSYLEKHIQMEEVDIIPLAISDRKQLLGEVNRLRQEQEILYVIGTYDPQLHGIPFISVTRLFDTPVDKLDVLLAVSNVEAIAQVDYDAIYAYLSEQLEGLDMKKLRNYLPKAIARIKRAAHGLSQDQELGLFLHIACAIQRMLMKGKMPVTMNRDSLIGRNKRLYNDLRDILQTLEKAFGIRFSDDELAYIIAIIKQI